MDAAIARIAYRQHSLILREQALAVGMTDEMIRHRIKTGRWARVAAGVYRLAGVPVTWKQRALAACLISGAGAVVSHRSAAVLWGVSGFRPGPLEITVPAGRSGRNALARVHRSDEVDGVLRDTVPVTRPSRMLADLAGVVSGDLLEEAVDDALCRRLCRLEDLHGGGPALREVVAAWNGDGMPDGVAEMRVVRRLVEAGLPQPVRQYEIWAGGVFVARVDLAYPPFRLAMELDGFRWHAGRRKFRSDRLRRNRLEAVGWRLLEAAPEDIDNLVAGAAAIVKRAA
ncbi:MAG TPA: type IV toxin-antitoxin system AbiEi family antitoxin domain-containing protein [Acidimicrobiales bacterium]|nr:type IV toxin-antitoxin system AbiEi family antitoxin domain-containing protein [Acidimicrobiales bacterium]